MPQVFGNFDEKLSTSEEYLIIGFSPSSIPIKQRWRNNGLSADFLADYLVTFFPASDTEPSTIDRQAEIKSAVSYIANELLENAMKFSDENSQYPISIQLQLHVDHIVFMVTNTISPQAVDKFQDFIQKLVNEDPQELYISRLESNADEEATNSGLGLLTMVNDYMAQLGWRFQTVGETHDITTVTTMVQLRV